MKIAIPYLAGMLLLISSTPALAGDVPALERALSAWANTATPPSSTHAFVDLNDDGIDDAVVLISDSQYCGSGGCTLVIFQGLADGFKHISTSSITREPILLLPEKRKGWHTLSVHVAGGGATPRQVMLRYNGKKYPGNPSMQPKATKNDLKGATTLLPEPKLLAEVEDFYPPVAFITLRKTGKITEFESGRVTTTKNPAIDLTYCGKSAVTYLWKGKKFSEICTSD